MGHLHSQVIYTETVFGTPTKPPKPGSSNVFRFLTSIEISGTPGLAEDTGIRPSGWLCSISMCWTFGPSTIHSVSSGTISDTQWLTYSPTIPLHVLGEQTRGSILHIALPRDNLVILHQVGHYSDSYPFTQGAKSPCGLSQQVFFFESQVVSKDVCPPSCLHSMEIPAIYLFVTRETRKRHLFCSQGALNPGYLSTAFYGSWQLIVLHTFPPIPVIPQVIFKLRVDWFKLILIALV